jgi:DNA primase
MNTNEIKELLTDDQITTLLISLGSDEPKSDNNGNYIYRTVCHHGDSHKLYYYKDSKMFKCYTNCSDSFDIFELVQRNRQCSFLESINYICGLFNIHQTRNKGFESSKHLIDDWKVIDKYIKNSYVPTNTTINIIDENTLNLFKNLYNESWIDDGISVETMKKYQIKFDVIRNKIIIPHFNINGQLIGIRGRALNIDEIEAGKKYMPIYVEKTEYNSPLGRNLYGLNKTKEAIKRIGKVVIFESEKSVLQCETFYGEDNFSVATCGSNITNYQKNLILQLGVREVFICYDKQFESKESEEAYKYADKLRRLASKFSSYVTTYVLWDNGDLLGFKESPSDRGRLVLEQLMKNKFEVKCDGEEMD